MVKTNNGKIKIIMATVWEGIDTEKKPTLKLDGKKVIVENVSVYDVSIPMSYRREVIYHFSNEDEAAEYYYKKR
jgi:hypothetical protein